MPWASQLSQLAKKRRAAWTWPLAVGIFVVCLALRLLLAAPLEQMKFLTFYPGIAAATLVCGWRQGLLVLLLSTVSAWYLFFEPFNSFHVGDSKTAASLIGFIFVAGFILVLVAGMRELIHRLENARRLQEELFRELQHRVANNLQLAVVMLRNARRGIEDKAALEAIGQAEERIDAMSRLHRRLHDGTALAESLQLVIDDVLAESFRGLRVEVSVDVDAGHALSLDQITALVLLVNEAATNAAKHVFRKGLGARFEVSLSRDEAGRLLLVIRDDGPGIRANPAEAQPGVALGMHIMQSFAMQLGGSLQIAEPPGATLRVAFAPA